MPNKIDELMFALTIWYIVELSLTNGPMFFGFHSFLFPKDLTLRMSTTIYLQGIFSLLKYQLKLFFNYNTETATSGHLTYQVK